MHKATSDPLVGRTVAQYEVVARLGGGGMGVVYAARDTKLGRRVALKFLPPQWSHDEGARQRFIREAQAASSTDHRNICTIHDIGSTDEGQLFIVMAHYDGQTLKQRLESGALPVDEAVEIAAQVAEGLAKAHAQGVVHRDIKPGNLMLTEDGVKILDFGLAKFAESRFKLTLEGSTIGTLAYMSPEQARGEEADARSDVWAVGVVLYEMLTGDVPFKGAYPEAIAHAIKNDPPSPLRGHGEAGPSEIPEALEHLVFRALHKNPSVRFQGARDLARALRQLQGRTIPLDLRTEPLPPLTADDRAMPVVGRPFTGRHGSWWRSRTGLSAAAAVSLLLVGGPLWVFAPAERMAVAVVPVINQTGDSELDGYRLGLTLELIATLADSRGVRVVPYDRTLQIVRRFRAQGGDVSSREAVQALAATTRAPVVVVPTLIRENGAWKARVEFRNSRTATTEASIDTEPIVSSLKKDTTYGLMASLAVEIDDHFRASGPRRARAAHRLMAVLGGSPLPSARHGSLDAAAAVARGVDAYEQQEHSIALREFTVAAQLEPRSALPQAWRSLVASIMGQDQEASEAAAEAVRLASDTTAPRDALFVAAVAAEARRDFGAATAQYQQLMAAYPDEPGWVMEFAAFQERRARTQQDVTAAITTQHRALALDGTLARPHLELCRLHNRLNDPPQARAEGQLALEAYQSLGSRAGEAQARWCLTDALRTGTPEDIAEARRHADAAATVVEGLELSYNLARAQYYVGLAAYEQGNRSEAAARWEQSLATARNTRNAVLEPLLLLNLGAAHVQLGDPARAAAYYQQGHERYQARGDERRAAQMQANRGALLIEYGPSPNEGMSELQNALVVSQKLGDRDFERFCRRLIARYHRVSGRYAEAEAELNRAIAIAKERNLTSDVQDLTVDLAASRLDANNYASALELLTREPLAGTTAHTLLAKAHAGVGDFAAADADLGEAEAGLQDSSDRRLLRILNTARGELAFEAGRWSEARVRFEQPAAEWTDDLPDEASVTARAYLGLLDALGGRVVRGRADIVASLEQFRKMGRFALEARGRVFLAQVDVAQRRFDDALAVLTAVASDDASRALGPELRARVHYWQGQALAGVGDRAGAQAHFDSARRLLADLRASLPPEHREGFASRREIRIILENSVRIGS